MKRTTCFETVSLEVVAKIVEQNKLAPLRHSQPDGAPKSHIQHELGMRPALRTPLRGTHVKQA